MALDPIVMHDLSRLNNMARLQNKLVKIINRYKLPKQDLCMVLAVMVRQVENDFMRSCGCK